MKIIRLHKHSNPLYIDQYVALRNKYAYNLYSTEVNVEGTKRYLEMTASVLVAVENNHVYGAVALSHHGEITIFVDKSMQRKNVGSQLVKAIEHVATHLNFKKVWVWVQNRNEGAIVFFNKNKYDQHHYFKKDLQ